MFPAFLRLVVAGLLVASAIAAGAAEVDGAGATFPQPLYARWIADYREAGGPAIDYRPIGSGLGIAEIEQRHVDFGATDMPLPADDLERRHLVQFPLVVGGVVPVINVTGIAPGGLMMTGKVLADIYLGRVRRWNDPAIAGLNPGITLPSSYITVVHREDASGSSFLWTDYLAGSSAEWKSRVGVGTRVKWPTGVGGEGNEGVASYVQRTRLSIGYVEYAYALKHRLSHVALRNRAGQVVQPSIESFAAAAEAVDWRSDDGFARVLVDRPEPAAWPVTGASFILLASPALRETRTREALKFFDWALASGRAAALELGYSPLPDPVASRVRAAWHDRVQDGSGRSLWPR